MREAGIRPARPPIRLSPAKSAGIVRAIGLRASSDGLGTMGERDVGKDGAMATATANATATEYPRQMYIDGQWRDAIGGGTLAVINPADESTIAEVAFGG